MNVFDKVCASVAFALGVVLLALGAAGLVFGCRAHFTLPPVVGVLPAFVGWGIVRSVYLAWRRRRPHAEPIPSESPLHPGGGDATNAGRADA